MSIKDIINSHMDDVAAFSGGAGFTLFGWLHLESQVAVGKVIATFMLGFVGGVAGIAAKYVCNSFTKKINKRKK